MNRTESYNTMLNQHIDEGMECISDVEPMIADIIAWAKYQTLTADLLDVRLGAMECTEVGSEELERMLQRGDMVAYFFNLRPGMTAYLADSINDDIDRIIEARRFDAVRDGDALPEYHEESILDMTNRIRDAKGC